MPLSIVIPAKNEEKFIGPLLQSLVLQEFDWSGSEILVADAQSVDKTRDIATDFKRNHGLPLKIVTGGLPAIARNNGARQAGNELLLFIDADVVLEDTQILQKTVQGFENPQVNLLTCNIRCKDDWKADLLLQTFNLVQQISKFEKPLASTMFFAIRKVEFWNLGGFDEKLQHLEDVFLSRAVLKKHFSILNSDLQTDNRRFHKMGYFNFALYCVNNSLHLSDREYFYQDIGYWK